MEQDTLLIKNGLILDPANGIKKRTDLAISNGKILSLGDFSQDRTKYMVDAKGCLVTPGLIDHHAHVYPLIKTGIPAEAVCFASGVTTVVDAGSTGCETYANTRKFIQRVLSLKLDLILTLVQKVIFFTRVRNMDPASFDEGRITEDCAKSK